MDVDCCNACAVGQRYTERFKSDSVFSLILYTMEAIRLRFSTKQTYNNSLSSFSSMRLHG